MKIEIHPHSDISRIRRVTFRHEKRAKMCRKKNGKNRMREITAVIRCAACVWLWLPPSRTRHLWRSFIHGFRWEDSQLIVYTVNFISTYTIWPRTFIIELLNRSSAVNHAQNMIYSYLHFTYKFHSTSGARVTHFMVFMKLWISHENHH